MDTSATNDANQSPAKAALPKPKGAWGTILTITPVVLTVLATAFAGMSSSELTQSMYYRSLASQQQSKAGDQWAFFQAERIRGTSLEMTVELLQSLAHAQTFDPRQVDAVTLQILQLLEKPGLPKTDTTGAMDKGMAEAAARVKKAREKLAQLLADPKNQENIAFLTGRALPEIESRTLPNKDVREQIDAVVEAIGKRQSEDATADRVRKLKPGDIEQATSLAEQNADAFDRACEPITDTMKQLRSSFSELNSAARPLQGISPNRSEKDSPVAQVMALLDGLNNSIKSALLDFDARRYRQESFYNRKVAELDEVRVRRSSLESDRHRDRSKKFFYSMLVAQAGVTIASLALARAQRSSLWLLAALAGLAALGFSGYVYLSP